VKAFLPKIRAFLQQLAGQELSAKSNGKAEEHPSARSAIVGADKALRALDEDGCAAASLALDTAMRADILADMIGDVPPTAAPLSAAAASEVPPAEAAEERRAAEAERRRARLAEEAAEHARREAAAAARRGPPPPLRAGWRVPEAQLPAVLAAWDFLGTFAETLWLPPIPLARLDAALCPTDDEADAADAATGAVLRDVHCALLRAVEGRAAKGAPVPPGPVAAASRTNIVPCVGALRTQGSRRALSARNTDRRRRAHRVDMSQRVDGAGGRACRRPPLAGATRACARGARARGARCRRAARRRRARGAPAGGLLCSASGGPPRAAARPARSRPRERPPAARARRWQSVTYVVNEVLASSRNACSFQSARKQSCHRKPWRAGPRLQRVCRTSTPSAALSATRQRAQTSCAA
jgi:DDT domain